MKITFDQANAALQHHLGYHLPPDQPGYFWTLVQDRGVGLFAHCVKLVKLNNNLTTGQMRHRALIELLEHLAKSPGTKYRNPYAGAARRQHEALDAQMMDRINRED